VFSSSYDRVFFEGRDDRWRRELAVSVEIWDFWTGDSFDRPNINLILDSRSFRIFDEDFVEWVWNVNLLFAFVSRDGAVSSRHNTYIEKRILKACRSQKPKVLCHLQQGRQSARGAWKNCVFNTIKYYYGSVPVDRFLNIIGPIVDGCVQLIIEPVQIKATKTIPLMVEYLYSPNYGFEQ
jgi:hypothetical protein